MILYFADRKLSILGQASTELPGGLTVSNDRKSQDVETGIDIFECKIQFDKETRADVEKFAMVGNYILRSNEGENEFYTIIDTELDTKKQTMYIYAEDAGLDLINEVVGEYEADSAKTIAHYIEMFAYDSGFRIGANQASGITKKLTFDNEQTVTARLASVAAQFGNFEIDYSFTIKGLQITNKLINIYQKRGQDNGVTLRLNVDIDKIIVCKSIAKLATALRATGGTPDNADDPITLRGYTYDDGDLYIDGDCMKSRSALKKWSRYLNPNEPNQREGHEGHIVRLFSYDTVSKQELCTKTAEELQAISDMEVNFEAEIKNLKGAKIGDRINIVDEAGELFLSTRLLQLETSVEQQENKAVLGEHLIKTSGISAKIESLAKQFAIRSKSAEKALSIAKTASTVATTAQNYADNALEEAGYAQQTATEAVTMANNAMQSATDANTKADNALVAVDTVEESVAGLETSVTNAQVAADKAQQAAEDAQQSADNAAGAATQAQAEASVANVAVQVAQTTAETAVTKAETAQSTATIAKSKAETAQATAEASKLDAERAIADIENLAENLETVSTTMQADYARKTDLTEATTSLQTQITQNATEITSTASRMQTIDETANNAQEQATVAQETAISAQTQAAQAREYAESAQTVANNATTAAANAQSKADTAKAEADEAKAVADQAEADLLSAIADLETITSRVGATEEEIAVAQQAVTVAQNAANQAQQDATTAAQNATIAQQTADTAVSNASVAQQAANTAASLANAAQATADEAKGNASTAQAKAEEATTAATTALATANTAKANATNAQAVADAATLAAQNAQLAADTADSKATQAATDLATAQQNLANVTARVGATEEEVEAAQQAVAKAQAAAEQAQADAETAQNTADTAKADAEVAQTVANNAKTAADNAQADAETAQTVADAAQAAVNSLAVRVTTAETSITQNTEQIAFMATKDELTESLSGFYTKEQSDSAIEQTSDSIRLSVQETFVEKSVFEESKESMQAELSMQKSQIEMNFATTSERIDNLDGELQDEVQSREKHITFTENGIVISAGQNTMTIRIDNDLIYFEKNGESFGRWDGENFHTGNIIIDVKNRAQFGPFAFVPRSDGSLALLKVK